MDITDFLTQNFLSSFTGSLVAVELIVSVTKGLPFIKKIPTKMYVFILGLAHLLIVKGTTGALEVSVESFYRLFINALVIAVILCGGYDTIMNKINVIKNTSKEIEAGNDESNNNENEIEVKDNIGNETEEDSSNNNVNEDLVEEKQEKYNE